MSDTINNIYAVCLAKVFNNDTFTIAKFKDISNTLDGEASNVGSFSLKGDYLINVGDKVYVSGKKDTKNTRYGLTYYADMVKKDVNLNNLSNNELVAYLQSLTSDSIAIQMSEVENIIDILNSGDKDSLMQIKGIGDSVADRILTLHSNQLDYSEALAKLKPYGLTKSAIIAVIRYYKSPDMAIKMVVDNPYNLTRLPGWGFKRADEVFLKFYKYSQEAFADTRRVVAYIDYMLDEQFRDRNTWITSQQMVAKTLEFIPKADIKFAAKHISEDSDYTIIDHPDGKRISKTKYFNMEMYVAKRLYQMQNAPVDDMIEVDETIARVEEEQGFPFDESQKSAIINMTKNNVNLLQGTAGVGKSATARGFVEIVKHNGLSIGQGALSGKAAKNLEESTGMPASTIHRLTGYGSQYPYNEENPMPYDIVIIDEVSMVSLDIAYMLLRAMKPSAKIVFIGDLSQLPSIGAGIAHGLFHSKFTPQSNLSKIHRQAQDSGIITHSLAVRAGFKHRELDIKTDTVTKYGVLQDMEYIFTDNRDDSSIVPTTMERYIGLVDQFGVDDVQIITQTRSNVLVLNKYAQMAVNPRKAEVPSLRIKAKDSKNKDVEYDLRVGDRVINTVNNYNTVDIDSVKVPIFNGNTGKIIDITQERNTTMIIIDFDGVGIIKYPYNEESDNIQLGYAISVHRVQGSTLKGVIIALPFHYMLNSRGLLYTAMTRASKFCSLVTSPRTLISTIDKELSITEQTNLQYFLDNVLTNSNQ